MTDQYTEFQYRFGDDFEEDPAEKQKPPAPVSHEQQMDQMILQGKLDLIDNCGGDVPTSDPNDRYDYITSMDNDQIRSRQHKQAKLANGSDTALHILENQKALIKHTGHSIHNSNRHFSNVGPVIGMLAGYTMIGPVAGLMAPPLIAGISDGIDLLNKKMVSWQCARIENTKKAITKCNDPLSDMDTKKENYKLILNRARTMGLVHTTEKVGFIATKILFAHAVEAFTAVLDFKELISTTRVHKKVKKKNSSELFLDAAVEMGDALGIEIAEHDISLPESNSKIKNIYNKVFDYFID